MYERKAFLTFLYFLCGVADYQYSSVIESSRAFYGGVTCWLEAVPYLMRSYATANATQQAILALRNTSQRAGESEPDYLVRFNKAFQRCGNVYPTSEPCTMFIDFLEPATRSLVSRYRTDKRRITYLELVQHAKAKVDALRARTSIHKSNSSKLLVLESDASSLPLTTEGIPQQGIDTVYLM